MNKKIKAVLSVILVLITLFCASAPAFSAAAAYENDLPIIYIYGRGRTIYNKSGKQILPFKEDPEDQLMAQFDRLLAAFTSGVLMKNWDVYCNELIAVVNEIYKDVKLDNNGEASNGSYAKPSAAPKEKKSDYKLKDYVFNYDFRLDPWQIAADLREYIDDVLAATGKKKVNLISRSLGTNFAAAYLTRYAKEAKNKIDTCILYVPTIEGSMIISSAFSGEFKFDSDLISNYVNNYMVDSETSELLKAVVNITYKMSLLDVGTGAVESVFEQIADTVVPEILRSSYGSWPSYWSMVDTEHFDKAKTLVFSGVENEYAGMIDKIDRMHNKVTSSFQQTLVSLKNSGVKINIIAKYNTPIPPLFEHSAIQADGLAELKSLSFGGTAADMGKTLSKSYLEEVKLSGCIDYVSDDLVIDASTGLFPDYTWYIKDCEHSDFPASIDTLIMNIFHTKKQVSVHDLSKYPQFLQYNSDKSLSPVESAKPGDGADDSDSEGGGLSGITNVLSVITGLFSRIIQIIKSLLGIA